MNSWWAILIIVLISFCIGLAVAMALWYHFEGKKDKKKKK